MNAQQSGLPFADGWSQEKEVQEAEEYFAALKTETSTAITVSRPDGQLVNSKGEIDISNWDFKSRIEAFEKQFPRDQYNIVMWDQHILSQIAPGTSMVPQYINPSMEDCWHGEDAKKMQLRPGQVEPKADFWIRIGNAAGVKLTQHSSEEIEIGGKKHLQILYIASMELPDGTIMFSEPVGKAMPVHTSSGSLQAHLFESVDKKAKRNAIKALLNFPTTMSEEQFKKPFIAAKVIYRPGIDETTDKLLAARQARTEAAIQQLYPHRATVDVQAHATPISVENFIQRIQEAQNLGDLNKIGAEIAKVQMTGEQRKELLNAFKARKTLLETGEVTPENQEGGQ